ncbi:glutamate-5-semialdehyde dehydrogenase [Intestinimonas butyriciproducens]|uniref:glutamate-5-semialdehyde dehydrogenase n=1 Tax=Intestinimonas butyriciproducens TaxID=1297617 RepID=UPI00195AC134|nr:glutamate-5-semialdehyde dehydrogenase [Intestinimonas butyriciproducens]MBM6917544.1 glutamate-5-semialdehyde dehydrogenase [Intestinimonas butyriciproducens]
MTDHLHQLAGRAKEAARQLALYDTEQKNRALLAIAQALEDNIPAILAANARDVESAQENGVRPTMIDRLRLDEGRVRSMAEGARQVAQLPDPTGNVLETIHRPNGMVIEKVSVPMGVIGIIYEARPNVTVDSAVLCFKAGSAAFLRGGKEAFFSNTQLAKVMRSALEQEGLCPDCVILLDDTSRETAQQMMGLRGYIDVLIPRGGAGLIRSVVENAKVPVIETGTGNCHIYVDKDADLDMAVEILYNAKCSRPSVCNAAESLLVHQDVAEEFLPRAKQKLDECKVEWRGSPRTVAILPGIAPATLEDYAAEYNDYILSCKVIDGLDEAIAHIRRYSTGHSECIVTRNEEAARRFARSVDSAAVYINASTRFTDGSEFGMGAEIGISTQKLHARGPMGLRELTSYKYVILGSGQVR